VHVITKLAKNHVYRSCYYIYSSISGDEEYEASWKGPESFTEIIVSPDMLAHHFPDALLDAIDALRERNYAPRNAAPDDTVGNGAQNSIA